MVSVIEGSSPSYPQTFLPSTLLNTFNLLQHATKGTSIENYSLYASDSSLHMLAVSMVRDFIAKKVALSLSLKSL